MRNGFFAAAGAMALGGTVAFGQAPSSTATPDQTPAATAPFSQAPALESGVPSGTGPCFGPPGCEADQDGSWGRITLSADYLLWWVRKGPTPGPLLTVGSAGDPIPGALGQPGTQPLFGDGGLDYHTFSGLRLNGSIGLASGLGLDGSFFILERRSLGFGAASDANGNPLIARPVINDLNSVPESYDTSFPGSVAGASTVVSDTRLWGYEINLAADLRGASRAISRSWPAIVT